MDNFNLTSNLEQILGLFAEAANETINETVDDIAADAEARAPKQLGALAATVVALHAGENNAERIADAEKDARELRADINFTLSAAPLDFSDEGHHAGAVEVLADYATLIHNGFGGRSARPFLEEAGHDGENEFEARGRRKFADKLGQ